MDTASREAEGKWCWKNLASYSSRWQFGGLFSPSANVDRHKVYRLLRTVLRTGEYNPGIGDFFPGLVIRVMHFACNKQVLGHYGVEMHDSKNSRPVGPTAQ